MSGACIKRMTFKKIIFVECGFSAGITQHSLIFSSNGNIENRPEVMPLA